MNFYNKPVRRPAVPIVSLIDILAILLIFFIVTTTFREKKILLQISVPKTSELESTATPEARVVIGVTPEGDIYLDGKPVGLADLPAALESLKAARPGIKLEIKSDETISIGNLVSIWDALAKAGFPKKDVPVLLQRPK